MRVLRINKFLYPKKKFRSYGKIENYAIDTMKIASIFILI